MREAWRRGRKADGTPSDILRGGVHVNMVCYDFLFPGIWLAFCHLCTLHQDNHQNKVVAGNRTTLTKFSSHTSNISSMLASVCYTLTYMGWLARDGIKYTNANVNGL